MNNTIGPGSNKPLITSFNKKFNISGEVQVDPSSHKLPETSDQFKLNSKPAVATQLDWGELFGAEPVQETEETEETGVAVLLKPSNANKPIASLSPVSNNDPEIQKKLMEAINIKEGYSNVTDASRLSNIFGYLT